MKSDISIRLATDRDKPQILQLLHTVFDEQQHFDWKRDEKYWQWKYDSNIFGKTYTHVAEHNKSVIAVSTIWPWQFICRGKILNTFQPCDTVVDPDYRRKGIFSNIYNNRMPLIKDKNASFLFNFPNTNSLNGNLKLGWNYLKNLEWLVKPLKPVNMVINLRDKSKSVPQKIDNDHKINIEDCNTIAEKYLTYDGIIQTYRQKEFFRWRYEEHPFFKYGMVTAQKSRKSAGAIFMVNAKNKIREMIVVDVFGANQLTPELFRMITKTGKQYNADYVTVIYNRHYNMQSLWKQGFIKMRNKNMVVLPLNLALEQKILNYANWSIIGAMHDSL